MSTSTKLLIAVVLLVGAFFGGFYYGKGEKEITVIETKGETKTVYKDRIVTVTKIVRPDGTVEETTKTEESEKKEETSTTDINSQTKPALSDYTVGAKYWLSKDILNSGIQNVEVTAGRRMFGEVWLDIGVKLDRTNPQGALGVSLNF